MPPSDGAGPSRPVVVAVWAAFLGWTTWCAATDPVPQWPVDDSRWATAAFMAFPLIAPPVLALVARRRIPDAPSTFRRWFLAVSPTLLVAAGAALAGGVLLVREAFGQSRPDAMLVGAWYIA